MARPTDDKKESTIRLRINTTLRRHIENKARESGVTMSEYIRKVLERHFRERG